MDEENKIEAFDPATIMFFIMGLASDISFLGLLGLAIPGVGFAIAMFVLGAHYFFGIIILGFFWGKTRGWLPKIFLLLGWILPLPLLTVGLILAIISSNKLAAFIIEQVAIQAVAVATAGAGEALEAGTVAAEGAEGVATAAEGVGAVGEAGEAMAEAGVEGAGVGEEAATAAGGAEENLFENPYEKPMETTGQELNEPSEEEFHEGEGFESETEKGGGEEPEGKSKAVGRVKKVFDIANRTNKPKEEEDDQDVDEDLPRAA